MLGFHSFMDNQPPKNVKLMLQPLNLKKVFLLYVHHVGRYMYFNGVSKGLNVLFKSMNCNAKNHIDNSYCVILGA